MLKGLCSAFDVFKEAKFLALAQKNAQFLIDKVYAEGKLKRNFKNGKASIDGYLEDYASVIDGLIALYETTFDEQWLSVAHTLTQTTIDQFFDKEEELFHFTSNSSEKLIARKKEIFDNVIPSSNAMMAQNLHKLGVLMDRQDYLDVSLKMLQRIDRIVTMAPQDLAHWASLYSMMTYPTAEIAIVSDHPIKAMHEINQHFVPNKILVAKRPKDQSGLALLEGREQVNNLSTFYLCYNKTCQLPVNSMTEMLGQIKS